MAPVTGNKIDPALRQRLLGQKKAMGSGLIIQNKNFSKGIFFIMPAKEGETPGVECTNIFSKTLNFGTTSPKTFGLACPISDYKAKLSLSGTKEERDAMYKACQLNVEYWMGVIPADDLGSVANPNIHIFRGNKTVYEAIIARMVDEDIGDDITDLLTGRPAMFKKTTENNKTRWTVDFLDRQPISDDPDYIEAVRVAVASMDISAKFFRVDWEKLGKIYLSLTGDEMDPSYKEQEGANAGAAGNDDEHTSAEVPAQTSTKTTVTTKATTPAAKGTVKPTPAAAAPAKGQPAKRQAAPPPPAEPEQPEPDANGIILGETLVQFSGGEDDFVGTAMKWQEELGKYEVMIPEGEAGAGLWDVAPDELTVIENDPAGEPEPPAAPAGPKKRTAAPPPQAEQASDEPGAGDDQGEQQEAAPAPRGGTKAPGKVTTTAAKPATTTAKAGLASSSLRSRVGNTKK